jgi:hypothetical protein
MKFTIEYIYLNQKGGMEEESNINFTVWAEFFKNKNESEYALFDIEKTYIGLANETNTVNEVINSANVIEIKEIDENDKNIYKELYGTYQYIKVTIDNFKKMLESNNDITLDEAILKFENSKFDTLENFAIKNRRKAEGYRTTFRNLFEKAKKMNNKN